MTLSVWMANNGETLNDESCHKASRAFFDAVPYKSDPIVGAGFAAFSDKLFAGNGAVYDPVCLDAMETFINSHSAGEDLLTSNLKAARSFFKAFVANPQTVPADSPCASATLSFAQTISKEPSSAANAAMLAYINEAIRKRDRVFDPVCGAASQYAREAAPHTECLTLCVVQLPWHTGMLSLRRRMRQLLVRLQLWLILMHLKITLILMRMALVGGLPKHTWLNLNNSKHQ